MDGFVDERILCPQGDFESLGDFKIGSHLRSVFEDAIGQALRWYIDLDRLQVAELGDVGVFRRDQFVEFEDLLGVVALVRVLRRSKM